MNVHVSNSPFVKTCLTKIRNKETNSYLFGKNIQRITVSLFSEASQSLELKNIKIETPLAVCESPVFKDGITVVTILRAGLMMSEALRETIDDCSVGHVGIYREELTLESVQYYEKMPLDISNNQVILCDPLIATGNSLISALEILKKYKIKKVFILGILASSQAIKTLNEKYPDVEIFVAAIDNELNSHGYLVPGVGDAGDRIFKTK